MELRPDEIQEILRVFADSPIEELRLEIGDTRLYLSKKAGASAPSAEGAPAASTPTARTSQPPKPAAPAAEPTATPARSDGRVASVTPGDEGLHELRAPLLGVFYRRPNPSEPPFVEVGSTVQPGDPVCMIDVMKMFTRVEAGVVGRVVDICVEDGQLVEYGQVLMRIEPLATAVESAAEAAP